METFEQRAMGYVDPARERYAEGASDDDVVAWLKEEGLSRSSSIVVVRAAREVGLETARNVVHLSDAWSDEHFGGKEGLRQDLRKRLLKDEP